MNLLTSWAKNIIYYVLFIKLISNLIPNGNMAKYIKLFSGMLLIFILIEPILTLRNIDQRFMKNILEMENEMFKESFISQSKTYNGVNEQLAIQLYKKKIETHIKEIVQKENMDLVWADIKIMEQEGESFGTVREINLNIRKPNAKSNVGIDIENIEIGKSNQHETIVSSEDIIIMKNIKTALFNFYNIPVDNININI